MNAVQSKTPKTKKPAVAKAQKNAAPAGVTLKALADGYVRHLEEAGKSHGTIFSYQMELNLALGELGAETDAASLTEKQVAAYFASDAVTKTRKGRAKAKPTVDKTRRVLRLALGWAAAKGLIAAAPIPESVSSHAKLNAKTA